MVVLPFQVGLRYNGGTSPRRADRAPGRCRAGEGLAWRLNLTGRSSSIASRRIGQTEYRALTSLLASRFCLRPCYGLPSPFATSPPRPACPRRRRVAPIAPGPELG